MPSSSLDSSPRRIVVPEEGHHSPLFGVVDAGDTVDATILFRGTLTEAQLDEAERAVLAWFAGAEWGDRLPILVDETLTASCLYVAVTGVRTAQHALGLLVDTLVGMGVPVARAVFARMRADGDRDALVRGMDPSAQAQVEYDDPREWWRACFDPKAAPPLSEDRAELARDNNALLEVGPTTYAERRGLPLHVSDIRICYGLADATFGSTGEAAGGPPSSGAGTSLRGHEVARVLHEALEERFCAGEPGALRPVPYNHLLQTDTPLDRIRAAGRAGYSCAFHAGDLREFLHNHLFRYREYELMLAVRDTVRALDLEPVVCWRRFNGRYVLQLWERGASLVHQAA
jgi:hypothetical protein